MKAITKVSVLGLASVLSLAGPVHADSFAYVANRFSHNVSVINTETNTVEATVAVGDTPFGVAITSDGAFAYIANQGSDNVSVINTATNAVDVTVPVGDQPLNVAITPDDAFAYVTNIDSDTVSVIDTATKAVDATVTVGTRPYDVAITPDGGFAYVTNQNSDTVSVINTATNTVEQTVALDDEPFVGIFPFHVAIAPDGAFAYVSNGSAATVSVINTATYAVDATVPVGNQPGGVAITPDSALVYVTQVFSNNLSVINTATNTVITTVAADDGPVNLAITPPLPRFDDVPLNYWAFSFIEILAGSGITAGCGGDNYCPEESVTRAQMAVFLERGMKGSDFVPPAASGNAFLDVGAGDFAANFIEQLLLDGITAGCGNGNYCPNATVTRAQMAVFLLRAKYGSAYSPPAATGVFGDVDLSYWAVAWIEQLAAEGITSGCGGGNYCPAAEVTRSQMAVFLVRAFNLG